MSYAPADAEGPQREWPAPPPSAPAPPGWGPPPPGSWAQPAAAAEPPEAGPPGGRRSRRGLWVALAAAVVGLLLVGSGFGVGWRLATSYITGTAAPIAQSPIRSVPQNPTTGQAGQPLDVQAITNKVAPAVVDINTVIDSLGQSAEAAGTGMVLTSAGEVLTNNHVIQGASSIKVSIPGHTGNYTASVVGVDPTADVALLQIQGVSGLPTVTLADSSNLSVGDPVVALGNALGQGGAPTVTTGSITALDQSVAVRNDSGGTEQFSGLIQNDAPISPGDSGGPLVNAAGQVIGMITAGSSSRFSRTTSTVGFAIPASTALDIVNQVRAGRASSSIIIGQPGYLGVGVVTLDSATAARLGLNVTSGALVTAVAQGSPAAQAGIARNAVITAIDGNAIASADALGPAIRTHKPGQRVQVTWTDQAGSHTATVALISGPAA